MAGRFTMLIAVVACFAPWLDAHAFLGGDSAALPAEAQALRGVLTVAQSAGFEAFEIADPNGGTIREYADSSGVIFAVSWRGPVAPNLQSLLGSYFASYTASLAALDHPGLRRSLRVTTPQAIVETGGHLRAYAGRAYLPAEVPAGVRLSDLR